MRLYPISRSGGFLRPLKIASPWTVRPGGQAGAGEGGAGGGVPPAFSQRDDARTPGTCATARYRHDAGWLQPRLGGIADSCARHRFADLRYAQDLHAPALAPVTTAHQVQALAGCSLGQSGLGAHVLFAAGLDGRPAKLAGLILKLDPPVDSGNVHRRHHVSGSEGAKYGKRG